MAHDLVELNIPNETKIELRVWTEKFKSIYMGLSDRSIPSDSREVAEALYEYNELLAGQKDPLVCVGIVGNNSNRYIAKIGVMCIALAEAYDDPSWKNGMAAKDFLLKIREIGSDIHLRRGPYDKVEIPDSYKELVRSMSSYALNNSVVMGIEDCFRTVGTTLCLDWKKPIETSMEEALNSAKVYEPEKNPNIPSTKQKTDLHKDTPGFGPKG